MPRPRNPERLSSVVSSAIDVFIARGYRRTQMSDVAEAAGIAKGTLYLYVESKEALFDLAVRTATEGWHEPERVPVPSPKPGETLRYVKQTLETEAVLPKLDAALAKKRVRDDRAELSEIVRELFGLMYERRVALKLVDRCAADYPDLAGAYYGVVRQAVPRLLEEYLLARLPAKRLGDVPVEALARGILEVIAFWAIHRHWDPAPTPVDEASAQNAAVRFALGALGA